MNRAVRFGSMILLLAAAFGCAGVKQTASPGTAGGTGTGNGPGIGGFGGGMMVVKPCNGMCADFPASPGGGNVQMGSTTHFTIAPVGADGKLVYWSTSGTTYFNGTPTGTETLLSGFAVGDEGVVEVLRPNQAAMKTWKQGLDQPQRSVTCIGCHTSTPDGSYIAFNDFYPWGAVLASGISPVGSAPPATILGV